MVISDRQVSSYLNVFLCKTKAATNFKRKIMVARYLVYHYFNLSKLQFG